MSNTLPQEEGDLTADKAQEVVKKLMEKLCIHRLVYIDDFFDDGVDWLIEHISVGIKTGKLEKLNSFFQEIDFDDDGFWKQDIRRQWEDSEEESQQALLDAFRKAEIVSNIDNDSVAATAIEYLIPAGVEYHAVSPKVYDRHRIEWLNEASNNKKILCLFDLEFKHTSPGEKVEMNGLLMLEREVNHVGARQSDYSGKALFGIFSHTFSIEEEREKGTIFSESNGIPQTVFLPISKERKNDSLKLAAGLQMLVLNIYTGSIKDIVKNTMSNAYDQACAELEKVSVFDFDNMILNSSLQEGVWEGETLLRLFLLLHRRKGLEGLAQNETAKKLNEFVHIARSIAKPRLSLHNSTDPLNLRRLELYEDGKTLNSFHTPLRTGDIFQLKSGYEYILLCPPCDLMVRSDGLRGMSQSELKQVDLFRVKDIQQDSFKKLTYEQISSLGFLKNYKNQKLGKVSFKEKVTVPVEILDLAVLNETGDCQIDLGNAPPIPPQFHPAWQARHSLLIKHFKKRASEMEPLVAMLTRPGISQDDRVFLEQMKIKILTLGVNERLPKPPSFNNNKFDFFFKRISHYHYSSSQHLVTRYAHFLSRAAEEHDFSLIQESID